MRKTEETSFVLLAPIYIYVYVYIYEQRPKNLLSGHIKHENRVIRVIIRIRMRAIRVIRFIRFTPGDSTPPMNLWGLKKRADFAYLIPGLS